VVDNNTADGNDGTDTLSNFEFLEFSDLTVTTSDATGATTSASGTGAIASATAGAATSSSSSSTSTSTASSSSGGGGATGFSGDMSTEIGQKNFVRFQAYQAQKRAEEWLAANPELAQAHLLSVQTAPQSKSAVEQSAVMKVAMSAVGQQSQTVAEIARNLYAQANILSLPTSNVADVISSTSIAKSVSTEIADRLVQQQNKSSVAVVSSQEVSYLLL
jgi:hypothetical protein